MVQIEMLKLQLWVNTKWEVTIVANQTKVKLCQKKAIIEFRRWHFEQVKNYFSVLDVAY